MGAAGKRYNKKTVWNLIPPQSQSSTYMNRTARGVLVVEDDLILSMVLVRMMEKLGYIVLEKSHSGAGAIAAAKKLHPDLILMDIQLKDDLDGISAMQEIRKESVVPVIYITGNSDRKNIERARETDFIDYLVKPIQMNELEKSIEKAFSVT